MTHVWVDHRVWLGDYLLSYRVGGLVRREGGRRLGVVGGAWNGVSVADGD